MNPQSHDYSSIYHLCHIHVTNTLPLSYILFSHKFNFNCIICITNNRHQVLFNSSILNFNLQKFEREKYKNKKKLTYSQKDKIDREKYKKITSQLVSNGLEFVPKTEIFLS